LPFLRFGAHLIGPTGTFEFTYVFVANLMHQVISKSHDMGCDVIFTPCAETSNIFAQFKFSASA
jgi:hypothetical protein